MSRKKPIPKEEYVSPNITFFPIAGARKEPEALATEIGVKNQINQLENTYIWGTKDNLPMLILDAINDSPAATCCVSVNEKFIRGSGFTDEGIGTMVIDKDGTTFADFHAQLCASIAPLQSFGVNFKFDGQSKITNSYPLGPEGLRLVAPPEKVKDIDWIKHNPYWGTLEYNQDYTCKYPVWNLAKLDEQIKELGTMFPGQVYFYRKPYAPYKHYPVPKFWSAKKWIYSDAKIATYVDELLENGFFQSVLMQVVGNPNEMSKNPKLMKEVVGDDGVKRKEAVYTVGQEHSMQMSQNFSGVRKAGTAMVQWLANIKDAINLQEFPTNVDFQFVESTISNIIRQIATATQVPGILANLPDTTSPLSGQDATKNAIEFVQTNTQGDRTTLENFYNNIMIPNLQKGTKAKVKIKNYIPLTTQVTVDKNVWDFLNEAEKADFVRNNVPNVKIIRVIADPLAPTVAPAVDPVTGEPAPAQPAVNDALKSLKISDINRVMSIVGKYEKGSLTIEQATQFLQGYGFTPEQITAWLTPTNGVLV